MRTQKIIVYFVLLIILIIFLALYVLGETTFFDDPNDVFIMGNFLPTDIGRSECNEDFEIVVPSNVIIAQGYTQQINITLQNTGSCTLRNITVSFDSNLGWASSSNVIGILLEHKYQTVTLNLSAPSGALGNYILTITADALEKHKDKKLQVLVSPEEQPLKNISGLPSITGNDILPSQKLEPIFPLVYSNKSEEKPAGVLDNVYILTTLDLILIIVIIFAVLYYYNLRRKV